MITYNLGFTGASILDNSQHFMFSRYKLVMAAGGVLTYTYKAEAKSKRVSKFLHMYFAHGLAALKTVLFKLQEN